MDCEPLLQRRQACYRKHGLDVNDHSQDLHRKGGSISSSNNNNKSSSGKRNVCLMATLAAKRCLAFQNSCELEALHYYGTPHDSKGPKALCASFDEIYCFGNPQIMKVDLHDSSARASSSSSASNDNRERVFAHHQKAKRQVVNNREKFKACHVMSDRMHQCLRKQIDGSIVLGSGRGATASGK